MTINTSSSREPNLIATGLPPPFFTRCSTTSRCGATSYSIALQLPQYCCRPPFVTASIPRQGWRGSHDRETRVQSRRGRRRIRGQAAGARHMLQPRVREAGLRLVPYASAGRATQGRGEQAKVLCYTLAIGGTCYKYVHLFIPTLICGRCPYVGLHDRQGNEIGILHKNVQQYLDQFCTSSRCMHMNVLEPVWFGAVLYVATMTSLARASSLLSRAR